MRYTRNKGLVAVAMMVVAVPLDNAILKEVAGPFPKDSLATKHSSLADEWNVDKNYPLKPEQLRGLLEVLRGPDGLRRLMFRQMLMSYQQYA
jgi:hypothetical protein